MNQWDLAGKKFGRLVAIEIDSSKGSTLLWLCRCDCGEEKVISSKSLIGKATRSCGCIRDEISATRMKEFRKLRKRKYPELETPERSRWNGRLIKAYGITLEEYEEVLKLQGGKCAICGYQPKEGYQRLHVDHEHKKKGRESVRGLLCWFCNGRLLWIIQRRSIDPIKIKEYLEDPPFKRLSNGRSD